MSTSPQRPTDVDSRFAREQHFELPDHVPPHNEGRTVAAWFAMLGVIIGSAIATLGVCLTSLVVVAVGAAVIVAALLGGVFLRQAGQGQRR